MIHFSFDENEKKKYFHFFEIKLMVNTTNDGCFAYNKNKQTNNKITI